MTRRLVYVARAVSLPALVVLATGHAAAQSQTAPSGPPKWEIEVHVGGVFSGNPTKGTSTMPDPAAAFTTFNGRPSRRVSSWFFGDGAEMMNQVNSSVNRAGRIVPLDSQFQRAGLERGGGANLGVRLSRALSNRLAAEFTLDYNTGSLDLRNETAQAIETTRASFETAWRDYFATVPAFFASSNVTTSKTITGKGGAQLFLTGALNLNLATQGPIRPYATVGGGLASSGGDDFDVALVGRYSFLGGGLFPIEETDNLTLRVSNAGNRFVGVIGGGIKGDFSARAGWRADVRAHISGNKSRTLLGARPAVVMGVPANAIAVTLSNPVIQFSAIPTQISSLSGSTLADFEVFKGSGTEVQWSASFGYFRRLGRGTTQAASAPRAQAAPSAPYVQNRKWEIDVHGGGLTGASPTGGTSAVPAAGEPYTVLFQSTHRVSSWYLEDGATLLFGAATGLLAGASRITPIDDVLTAAGIERRGGATFGVRVTRHLTPRFSAEFSLDSSAGKIAMTTETTEGLEATRSSYQPAWGAFFSRAPVQNTTITSTLTKNDELGSQLVVTGALNINLTRPQSIQPYVTIGLGVLSPRGDSPSASLEGVIRHELIGLPGVPFGSNDAISVRFSPGGNRLVTVLGAGVKRDVSSRWGFRADLRWLIGPNKAETLFTASPSIVTSTPPMISVTTASPTTPSVVLSNHPTNRTQNLTGPALADFRTFKGTGRIVQTQITFGWYMRF